MKKTGMILTVLFMVLSFTNFAQKPTTGFEGKWKVSADSPMGQSVFTMQLERVDGVLTGNIQREGEEAVKFYKVDEKENEVVVYFHSSSGYDVDFRLKKQDENKISGTAMGMYALNIERMK